MGRTQLLVLHSCSDALRYSGQRRIIDRPQVFPDGLSFFFFFSEPSVGSKYMHLYHADVSNVADVGLYKIPSKQESLGKQHKRSRKKNQLQTCISIANCSWWHLLLFLLVL